MLTKRTDNVWCRSMLENAICSDNTCILKNICDPYMFRKKKTLDLRNIPAKF